MRKNAIKFLTLFIIPFLLSSFLCVEGALSQDQKNFLWKVQSTTGAVYVLGSIHLLKKEIYPLSRKIEDAFERSKALVVEANINDISQISVEKLIKDAFYPENDTLEKHISRETYGLVKKELGELGAPIEIVNTQRPWFLALTLLSLKLMRSDFDPNYGIDKYFLSKAEGKKRILELESLDYQINLLANLSNEEQEQFLLYTLRDINNLKDEMDKIVEAWISGDTNAMESIVLKNFTGKKMSSIHEKLFYERNRNMALKIEDFLKTGETYFIVVGAGHLIGNKGVIDILKGKGYLVEQM